MRLLIIILLFSIKAQGQVINASSPYIPIGCSGLLLDCVPNAVGAYSLRKVRTAYTGNCIRVRRSSDNTESDIGFVGNELDTATLKTFVGGSGHGFVVTWYTQIGSNNASQSTASSQPQIVNSGAVIRTNGKVSLSYNPSQLIFTTTTYTHAAIIANNNTINLVNYVLSDNNVGLYWGGTFASVTGIGGFDGTNLRNSTTENTNQNVAFFSMRSSSLFITVNGGSESNTGTFPSSLSPTIIGGRNLTNLAHIGGIQEVIMWNSNVSSNAASVLSNINSYYSIY